MRAIAAPTGKISLPRPILECSGGKWPPLFLLLLLAIARLASLRFHPNLDDALVSRRALPRAAHGCPPCARENPLSPPARYASPLFHLPSFRAAPQKSFGRLSSLFFFGLALVSSHASRGNGKFLGNVDVRAFSTLRRRRGWFARFAFVLQARTHSGASEREALSQFANDDDGDVPSAREEERVSRKQATALRPI